MSFPKPEAGLVVPYSYLWLREHREGRDEGAKDRPCAIILAAHNHDGETEVLVVPITHSAPEKDSAALEIPTAVKKHLGLDGERSWVVFSESNLFEWPGPDLRRVNNGDDSSIAYGFLPPRFFKELRRRFMELESAMRSRRVQRTQ